MAYRREDIERVRLATDLVELVGEVTKVKRSGRSVMAVCPFHQEKTASMSIDPARGLYHCFGCGKSGDLFRFVQETQALDFNDAVELLARRTGITLQRDPQAEKRRSRRQALVDATDAAVAFYHERLRSAPDASGARRYVRGRGYDGEVAETFQMGFSPPGGEALVSALRERDLTEEVLVAAGLAVRARTGRIYDRFRGRLMFPIYDLRGDAVGFGARLLDGDGPKYLNSPETAIYRKSELLYGLNWSKSEMVRSGHSVVVEGYTDVIGLHMAGMPVAVATCGTALVDMHLDLLRRFTERVVLMFDADEAGAGASIRGFEKSVPGDLDLRVAALPEGRDPADIAAAGEVETLRKSIESSVPLLQFRLESELERFDLTEAEARGRAVRAAADIIARHPDPVTRHEYAVFVARRTGVDLEMVDRATKRAASPRGTESRPPRRAPTAPLTGAEKAERELLRLLLANDAGVRDLDIRLDMFTREDHAAGYELLAPAVAGLAAGQPPDLGSLLGEDDTDVSVMLRGLAFIDRPLADPGEVVRKIHEGALDRRIQELRRQVQQLDPEDEPEVYSARFEELIALERERREVWSPE